MRKESARAGSPLCPSPRDGGTQIGVSAFQVFQIASRLDDRCPRYPARRPEFRYFALATMITSRSSAPARSSNSPRRCWPSLIQPFCWVGTSPNHPRNGRKALRSIFLIQLSNSLPRHSGARVKRASPESISPDIRAAPWIPGLRLTAHPGMTIRLKDTPPHSRGRFCPSFAGNNVPHRQEGAGKAGCSMRTRSLASEKMEGHELQSPQVRQRQSGFSCTIGFNGFLRALSGDRAFLSPSPADHPADLMPASRHLLPAFQSSCAIRGPIFTNFGKLRAAEDPGIPVSLSILKFLGELAAYSVRTSKSAALDHTTSPSARTPLVRRRHASIASLAQRS